jgi:hypothetical protein
MSNISNNIEPILKIPGSISQLNRSKGVNMSGSDLKVPETDSKNTKRKSMKCEKILNGTRSFSKESKENDRYCFHTPTSRCPASRQSKRA